MTWDPVRERVVLFGGLGSAVLYSDTWEWDGLEWLPRLLPTTPPPTYGHAAAWDPASERLVISEGFADSGWGPGSAKVPWHIIRKRGYACTNLGRGRVWMGMHIHNQKKLTYQPETPGKGAGPPPPWYPERTESGPRR